MSRNACYPKALSLEESCDGLRDLVIEFTLSDKTILLVMDMAKM
jgi:hypothetical protein